MCFHALSHRPHGERAQQQALDSADGRYTRGGRRRSLNQARYSSIFARCLVGAWRLQVDASSLVSGAPQRSSTQSFTLYAISRSTTRWITSLSVSVQGELLLRRYENVRSASSVASTLANSFFTSVGLLPLGIA